MTSITHKRVEYTELFYDLVFVYAISKTTALIHHLDNGMVTFESMLTFLLTLIILLNNWLIQTGFTNRHGKNSLLNMFVSYLNMGILLFISNLITQEWELAFQKFCLALGTLSLTLFVQYLIEYMKKRTSCGSLRTIRGLLWLTGFRAVSVYTASFLPLKFGVPIFLAGFLSTFAMPIFMEMRGEKFISNLPHLIERLSLLVIITFGEMVMGLAHFFTTEDFSINSVLLFIIMASLFLFYFGEFDHAIDEATDANISFLIYSHIPIIVGLIVITVSMSFLVLPSVNHLFAASFFYFGIAIFQGATLANSKYNIEDFKFPKCYYAFQIVLYLCGLILSLLLSKNPDAVILITSIMSVCQTGIFIVYFVKKKPDYDLLKL
jgi:bacterial low temperature requirement A protein (ltrA)